MQQLKNYIYQYEFKPEVKQAIKSTKDKVLTTNTINKFLEHHGNDYKFSINSIKITLYKIREQEKVIFFDNTKIYYHTYNILFLIKRYLSVIDFYNSQEYRKTFAGLRSNESEVLDKYHLHRANSFDSSNAFTGDDKIKALVFRNFYFNREITNLFINFYTLFPKHIIKVSTEDIFFKKIIDRIIEHFSNTYISSEEVIYKSLAISLNAYFRLKMKMQAKHSKMVTEEILSTLFDYTFSASSADLLRNIYIAGRLKELPIFKHAKSPRVLKEKTVKDFDSLFNKIQKEFPDLGEIPLDAKSYFQENPIKQFLQLSPMEFFQEIP